MPPDDPHRAAALRHLTPRERELVESHRATFRAIARDMAAGARVASAAELVAAAAVPIPEVVP